jgi:hypothetical protein
MIGLVSTWPMRASSLWGGVKAQPCSQALQLHAALDRSGAIGSLVLRRERFGNSDGELLHDEWNEGM